MTETPTTIRRDVVVPTGAAEAFTTFTERFGDFKPREHNLLASPIARTTFEPYVGGHIVDRGADGSECRWARILAFEPPTRVVFSEHEHRLIERHGPAWSAVVEGAGGDDGWPLYLARCAALLGG